jgi:repressor LexA
MQTRTRRQKEIFEFITRYIETHGCEPSYQMIARAMNLRSKAGIAKHIQALENQGLLTKQRKNGSFFLEIHKTGSTAEGVCEIEWLDVPKEGTFKEEWENAALCVPKFMLGIYPASKISAYRVPDDSMADRAICEGDIALIERRHFVRDGDSVVAVIDEEMSVLRGHYRDGSRIELRASNERFDPIRLPADQVEIMGVYRGLLRPIS